MWLKKKEKNESIIIYTLISHFFSFFRSLFQLGNLKSFSWRSRIIFFNIHIYFLCDESGIYRHCVMLEKSLLKLSKKIRARMQRHRDKKQCKWREIYRRQPGVLTARARNRRRRERDRLYNSQKIIMEIISKMIDGSKPILYEVEQKENKKKW